MHISRATHATQLRSASLISTLPQAGRDLRFEIGPETELGKFRPASESKARSAAYRVPSGVDRWVPVNRLGAIDPKVAVAPPL
jgi:hypothetical protein